MTDYISDFRAELKQAGLGFEGQIIADGVRHRFKAEGDKEQNSWYILYPNDGFPVGVYGCWKRQLKMTTCLKNGKQPSQADWDRIKAKMQEAEAEHKAEEIERQASAAKKAQEIYENAIVPTPQHAYLLKKKVGIWGELCEGQSGQLILPLRDITGKLHSLQTITADGFKKFLYGGMVQGCFYSVFFDETSPLVICEGYATGASIYDATKFAVVCAMNCGNVLTVAKAFREKYPARWIIIAADNDKIQTCVECDSKVNVDDHPEICPACSKPHKKINAGVKKSMEAAREVHCGMSLPSFPEHCEGTDFNDLMLCAGVEAVAGCFRNTDEPEGETAHEEQPAEIENQRDLPPIVDSHDFLAQNIPEPAQLVEGLLHMGTKLVLGGSSKAFKSWTLLDLAFAVTTGTPFLGMNTKIGKVLHINFEIQSFAWQHRIFKIAEGKQSAPAPGLFHLWNLRGYSADFRVLIPKIIERTKKEGYSLIIIDPIYKIYGNTDENSAGDVSQLLNELERLCQQTGAAIAYGSHFAKGDASSKNAIDRISGSGVFARDPDSILVFTQHEEDEAFTVESILRNFRRIPPFVVRWDFPLMKRDDDLDPNDLKTAKTSKTGRPAKYEAQDVLKLLPNTGLTAYDWQEAAEAAGISGSTFKRLKNDLWMDGKLHRDRVLGLYKPILSKKSEDTAS